MRQWYPPLILPLKPAHKRTAGEEEGARLFRYCGLAAVPWISASFLVSCSGGPKRRTEARIVSLCELRDKPQQFLGKTIRTSGWVYTDIENFDLTDDKCAVAFGDLEGKGTILADDAQQDRFQKLLNGAKKGTFNSDREVFAVVEGRFQASSRRTNASNSVRASNKLLLTRIICSAPVLMAQTSVANALSSCSQSQAGAQAPTQ